MVASEVYSGHQRATPENLQRPTIIIAPTREYWQLAQWRVTTSRLFREFADRDEM